jgi:hypothetical protein
MRDSYAAVARAIVFVLSTSACTQSDPNPPPEARFVGTWELVSVVTRWPDGRVTLGAFVLLQLGTGWCRT